MTSRKLVGILYCSVALISLMTSTMSDMRAPKDDEGHRPRPTRPAST